MALDSSIYELRLLDHDVLAPLIIRSSYKIISWLWCLWKIQNFPWRIKTFSGFNACSTIICSKPIWCTLVSNNDCIVRIHTSYLFNQMGFDRILDNFFFPYFFPRKWKRKTEIWPSQSSTEGMDGDSLAGLPTNPDWATLAFTFSWLTAQIDEGICLASLSKSKTQFKSLARTHLLN